MKIVEVVPLAELPESGHVLRSGPFQIAFFRVGDEVRAIDNTCPHAGAELAEGYVENDSVACPWHCWEFDTKTGKCLTVEDMDVETYETVVEDGVVKVKLPD
jgi:nitrite reductase (NADH) small subunit